MSMQAVTWALEQWKRANITASERVVLMALADHHNKKTDLCCPGQKLLAEECGLTDRGVRKQLSSLEEKNIISRRPVYQNNVQIGVQYTLSFGVEPRSAREERGVEPRSARTIKTNEIDKSISCKAKNGSRLPVDWIPEPLEIEWLSKNGISKDILEFEFDKFKDYWSGVPGARGRKLDWQGTWRNWLRNGKRPKPVNQKNQHSRQMAAFAKYAESENEQIENQTVDGAVHRLSVTGQGGIGG